MTNGFDDFNEFERSMWEQRATDYADGFEAVTALTIEALLDAAGTRAGTDLLDVGTGPGFVAAAAVARGANVTGIDVADSMVELAQARVPAGRFRRASAEALPLPDDAFDAVVGNFVLLHLGHPDLGVAEARRVLRGGGRCAFTVWEPAALNRSIGVFHEAVERAGVESPADVPLGPPMFRFGDHDTFAGLLREAGFHSITVEQCTGALRIDPGDWWESVLRSTPRTGSLIARQTPQVQAAIRGHYEELVAPYASGAEVVLPVAAVLASGVAPGS
jgi:Methylase involved in ubiquinone/menaquinone biosynthesis